MGTFIYGLNMGRVFCSPFDVVLSDTDVVKPDLLFVSKGREDIIRQRTYGARRIWW